MIFSSVLNRAPAALAHPHRGQALRLQDLPHHALQPQVQRGQAHQQAAQRGQEGGAQVPPRGRGHGGLGIADFLKNLLSLELYHSTPIMRTG